MAFLPAVAAGASVAGTAVSTYGMLKQGKAAQQEANYRAAEEERASVVAQQNARKALDEAEREAAEIAEAKARNLGAQQAAVAGSGITMSGSATHVLRDSAIQADEEIAMTRYRGQIEAHNFGTEANSLLTQSRLTRMSGRNARKALNLQAGANFLQGMSSAGSNYYSATKGR